MRFLEVLDSWMKSKGALRLRSALMPAKADTRKRRRSMLNYHLAFAAFCNHFVGCCDLVQSEPLLGQQRLQLILLGKLSRFLKNLPMMCAVHSRQQRHQCEDNRVCSCAKRKRRKRMHAPTETAYDMAGVAFYRHERHVQHFAAEGVIDDVEAFTAGVLSGVLFHRRTSVDRDHAQGFEYRSLVA